MPMEPFLPGAPAGARMVILLARNAPAVAHLASGGRSYSEATP